MCHSEDAGLGGFFLVTLVLYVNVLKNVWVAGNHFELKEHIRKEKWNVMYLSDAKPLCWKQFFLISTSDWLLFQYKKWQYGGKKINYYWCHCSTISHLFPELISMEARSNCDLARQPYCKFNAAVVAVAIQLFDHQAGQLKEVLIVLKSMLKNLACITHQYVSRCEWLCIHEA